MKLVNKITQVCTVAILGLSALQAQADCSTEMPPYTLNLQTATTRLLACNRDLIEAQQLLKSSQADVLIAGERPNPNLSLGIGSISPKYGVGSGGYWDKTVDTTVRYEQLWERGNKRDLRVKTTENLAKAAQQDVASLEKQQRVQLSQLLVDLALLDARINLLTEVTDIGKEALQASNIRLQKSDIPKLDVDRQSLDLNRAVIDLHQAETVKQAKQIELASLLAWEDKTNILLVDQLVLDTNVGAKATFNADQFVEVKAAQARLESASAANELALAQRTRDVTAGLQYDHWPVSLRNTNGTGDTVGFSVTLPLFVNHNYEGEVARASSDLDAAKAHADSVRAGAMTVWSRLNAQIEHARSRLNLLQQSHLPKAEQVAANIEFGYKKGAIDLLDLLDARRLLRQTKLDVLDAKAELARAILEKNEWTMSNEASTK